MNHKNYKAEKQHYRNTYGMLRGTNLETIVRNEQVSIDFLKEYGRVDLPKKSRYYTVIGAFLANQTVNEEVADMFNDCLHTNTFSYNEKVDIGVMEKYFDKLYDNEHYLKHPKARIEFIEERFEDFKNPYRIIEDCDLTEDFLFKKMFELNIERIFVMRKIAESTIEEHLDKLTEKQKNYVFRNRRFSFDFLNRNKDHIDWYQASSNINFTHEQQEELKHYIHWSEFQGRDISPVILREYARFFGFGNIASRFLMEESFIEEHFYKFDNSDLWRKQKLSVDFILRHPEVIDWNRPQHQTIPEELVWEKRENIDYEYVQTMPVSERLMEYYIQKDLNYWRNEYFHSGVAYNQNFTMEFYKKHAKILDLFDLNRNDKIEDSIKEMYNTKMKLQNMFKS